MRLFSKDILVISSLILIALELYLGSPEEDKTGAVALGMLDSPYHQRDDHHSKGNVRIRISISDKLENSPL